MATVILKVTERCNSNCYYCDVVRKAKTGQTMPLETLEAVFRRTGEHLRERPGENVHFIWHGGEPLLVGADYYREATGMLERHCGDVRSRISHSLQTNLNVLTDELVDVLWEMGIRAFGTSYDPEPHMRGPGAEIDSEAYNRRFLKSVALLDRRGIGWGVIYVVTRRSIEKPLDLFHFFTNFCPQGSFNMNPVLIYDEERIDVAISPEEYVDFLGEIFPVWLKHRNRYPSVQPFKNLYETIVEGHVSLGCVESGACTYRHINVTPDGETSQCGRSADWGLLPYGNIHDRTLAEILSDGRRDELEDRVQLLQKGECGSCRFWQICHGGCPLDAWSKHKSFMHKSEWCESRRGFITRYVEPITGKRFEPKADDEVRRDLRR